MNTDIGFHDDIRIKSIEIERKFEIKLHNYFSKYDFCQNMGINSDIYLAHVM